MDSGDVAWMLTSSALVFFMVTETLVRVTFGHLRFLLDADAWPRVFLCGVSDLPVPRVLMAFFGQNGSAATLSYDDNAKHGRAWYAVCIVVLRTMRV